MSTVRDLFTKPVLIFGCGNVLVGDDGFGPAVMDHLLANYPLPGHVAALDVGTSIRELLFDLVLLPDKPRTIFIVDSVSESDRAPGELFEMDISRIPIHKVNDFSLHMFPSVNLLNDLQEGAGVEIRVLAVQTGKLPDEIRPGLSAPVRAAVPKACEWLLREVEVLS
ncbi:MAG: hydrogenase maturation protease [Desulfobacteraceae bacterium]|nr:hydrogenase maturation protease [Desulfobacteraceae bacterium]